MLQKKDINFRTSISPEQQLVLTLRSVRHSVPYYGNNNNNKKALVLKINHELVIRLKILQILHAAYFVQIAFIKI